jgi:hypothetical protein
MEQQQETLGINDLKLMAQVIKVVSTRGAIQAEEMAAVGILYTKLISFIKSATPNELAMPNESAEDEATADSIVTEVTDSSN